MAPQSAQGGTMEPTKDFLVFMKILEYFKKRKAEKKKKYEQLSKTRKVIRRTGGWLLYFGVLALLIFGTPKALSYLLDTQYPIAAITSGSMWPVLKKGDLALVCGVQAENILVNDVVIFPIEEGVLGIHRVVRINGNQIITKGDANTREDQPISREAVIGRLCTLGQYNVRIPKFGMLASIFQQIK